MTFDPGVIRQLFNLKQDATKYTFLEIVFTRLKHVDIKQKPAFTSARLMGTLGGLFGLYMGISVISMFEIGEVVCVIAHRLFHRVLDRH